MLRDKLRKEQQKASVTALSISARKTKNFWSIFKRISDKEVIRLEEIEVKNNPLGIKIYAVGKPDIEHMTEDEYNLFISSLELRMTEYLEKKAD